MKKVVVMSKYVGKEIELEIESFESNGNIITNISHDSLEKAIYNEVPNELQVKISMPEILTVSGINHPVVVRSISDITGRCIRKVGEASPATLTNDISKSYPVTMADIRAFDRAVISYLNLDIAGKIYSLEEGVRASETTSLPKEEFEAFVEDAQEPASEMVTDSVDTDSVDFGTDFEAEDAAVSAEIDAYIAANTEMHEQEKGEKKPEETLSEEDFLAFLNDESEPEPDHEAELEPAISEPVVEKSEPEPLSDDFYGEVIISIGKYANSPKKVREIFADGDIGWCKYMTTDYNANTEDKKTQINALRTYGNERGLL